MNSHRSCVFGTNSVIGQQSRVVGLPWKLKGICSIGLYSDNCCPGIAAKILCQSSVLVVKWLWIQSARSYHSLLLQ